MNEMLSAEQVLKEKGVLVETTVGTSMLPLFKNRRDRVIIKPVTARLEKYDVPLYRRGNKLVLHRIIEVRENDYIICGDNCEDFETVKDEQVIGVLSAFYRRKKYYTVEDKAYILYSKAWVSIYPLRMVYKKLRHFAAGIYHKIRRENGRV